MSSPIRLLIAPPGRGETMENLGALLVVIQRLKHRLELPDDFFGAVYQVQFVSRSM